MSRNPDVSSEPAIWTPEQAAQLERDRETLLGAARALDRLFDAGRKKAVAELEPLGADQLKQIERLGKQLAATAAEVRRTKRNPRARR